MKKYIGTKEVLAQPMTAKEAIEKGYKVNNHTDDGYEVEYKDGYKSWSPKEVFEEAYKLAETPLDRIKIERTSLIDNINALEVFLYSDESSKLDITTQAMLEAQGKIMISYLKLLTSRSISMETGIFQRSKFNFGVAIELLETGCILRRCSWDNKDSIIIMQNPTHLGCNAIPSIENLSELTKNLLMKTSKYASFARQCLIINIKTGDIEPWTPSISDIFAEDWELINTQTK